MRNTNKVVREVHRGNRVSGKRRAETALRQRFIAQQSMSVAKSFKSISRGKAKGNVDLRV